MLMNGIKYQPSLHGSCQFAQYKWVYMEINKVACSTMMSLPDCIITFYLVYILVETD